jgi:hypothetical protein
MDFVAGKNRVPWPATGKIALVTLCFIFSKYFSTMVEPTEILAKD